MGLNISVYRNAEFGDVDCSNGGITGKFTQLNVVNVSKLSNLNQIFHQFFWLMTDQWVDHIQN